MKRMLVHVLSMTPGQQAKLKYRRAAACASYPVCHFHYGTGWCRCWLLVVCTIAGRSVVKPTVRSLLSTLRCPLSASIAVVGCPCLAVHCPAVHCLLSDLRCHAVTLGARCSLFCSPVSVSMSALRSPLSCCPSARLSACPRVRLSRCHAVMLSRCHAVTLSRCPLFTVHWPLTAVST